MARILLDENLDWRLSRDLPGHTVESVPLIGWAGLENGELLIRLNQLLMSSSQWIPISCIKEKSPVTK